MFGVAVVGNASLASWAKTKITFGRSDWNDSHKGAAPPLVLPMRRRWCNARLDVRLWRRDPIAVDMPSRLVEQQRAAQSVSRGRDDYARINRRCFRSRTCRSCYSRRGANLTIYRAFVLCWARGGSKKLVVVGAGDRSHRGYRRLEDAVTVSVGRSIGFGPPFRACHRLLTHQK